MKGIHCRAGDGMAETFLCERHYANDELRLDRERVAARRPGTDALDLTWHDIPNIPDRFCTASHDLPAGVVAQLAQAPQTFGYVNDYTADLRRSMLAARTQQMYRR